MAKHVVIGKPVSFYTITLHSWISGEYLYLGTSLPNTAISVDGNSKVTDSSGNVVLGQRIICNEGWGTDCNTSTKYNVVIKGISKIFTYYYSEWFYTSGCGDSTCAYTRHYSQSLLPKSVVLKPN